MNKPLTMEQWIDVQPKREKLHKLFIKYGLKGSLAAELYEELEKLLSEQGVQVSDTTEARTENRTAATKELTLHNAPIDYTKAEASAWASGYNTCLSKQSERIAELEEALRSVYGEMKSVGMHTLPIGEHINTLLNSK